MNVNQSKFSHCTFSFPGSNHLIQTLYAQLTRGFGQVGDPSFHLLQVCRWWLERVWDKLTVSSMARAVWVVHIIILTLCSWQDIYTKKTKASIGEKKVSQYHIELMCHHLVPANYYDLFLEGGSSTYILSVHSRTLSTLVPCAKVKISFHNDINTSYFSSVHQVD